MRFDYQLPITRSKTGIFVQKSKPFVLFLAIACATFYFSSAKTPETESTSEDTIEIESKYDHAKNVVNQKLLSISNMTSLSFNKLLKNDSSEKPSVDIDKPAEEVAKVSKKTESWKSYTVLHGDSLSKIFQKMAVSHDTLDKILKSDPSHKRQLRSIHPGQSLDFSFDENGDFKELKFQVSTTKTLHIRKSSQEPNGFKSYYEEKQLVKKLGYSTGIIQGSLYQSAQNAGLNDKLIMQMVEIFSWDIDFNLDIRNGDRFQIVFEEEYLDTKKIDSGDILAVEFHNQGKIFKAVKFTHDEKSGYYSPEGFSLQKAFLRTPVKFSRISSHFSPARNHPILHKIRAHNGVDYAAPHGTPVKATGDGKVTFMGNKGGYGRCIEISHGQKYSTFYAHLSKFNSAIKHGSYVKQGQIIGHVGHTGLATGDHLHYEFRINGIHRNPLTVKLPKSLPVSEKKKSEFSLHAKNMFELLDSYTIARIASKDKS
jgi:murein DD-endopeptidase MepM/ murein hydrolase activator NlpD